MQWKHSIPFLSIFIPFVIGLISYTYFPKTTFLFIPIFFIAWLLFFIFEQSPFEFKLKYNWLRGFIILTAIFSCGFLTHYLRDSSVTMFSEKKDTSHLIVQVKTPPQEKDNTFKCEVEIIKSIENDKQLTESIKSFIYLKKADSLNETINKIEVGSQLLIANKLQPITNRGNPGEFDYARFCANKEVKEQAFLSQTEWKLLDTKNATFIPFAKWSRNIRNILAQNIPDTSSWGIAQALLVGYRQDISAETYQAYTNTGLVHLIAISGLHMGIFYGGIFWLLGWLPFFKKNKRTRIIISLCFMWLFAFITALPPSVLRAAIMFSFLGLGQMMFRRTHSLNFLFASAFVLLIYNPNFIYDVGFQLSYCAVLGILLFYRPINNLFYFKNKLIRYCWSLMCISLAVQVLTFPLSIYYFHQLPVLFLLTNLVAIPLVTLIIYGEILIIVSSFLPTVSKIIGYTVSKIILALNNFIQRTSEFSFVRIKEISLEPSQLVLCYMLILFISIWLLNKKRTFAFPALITMLLLLGNSLFIKAKSLKQEKLIIYNNYEQPYIEYIRANNSIALDTVLTDQLFNVEKYISEPARIHFHTAIQSRIAKTISSNEHLDMISIGNSTIIRLRKSYKLKLANPIKTDYLIISDKYIRNLQEMVKCFNPKEIIIDGNIPLWKVKTLKSELSALALPVHIVPEQGAKIISL